MGLPNIGPLELIIILAVLLLIVGPRRLPEMGQAVGRTIKEFRKASTDITEAATVSNDNKTPVAPTPAPVAPTPAPVAPTPAPRPVSDPYAAAPAPVTPVAPAPDAVAPAPAADGVAVAAPMTAPTDDSARQG
jgi:TatA/E family protein of Tat protein translocase